MSDLDEFDRLRKQLDKYEQALLANSNENPSREAIAAAIRETQYKYFGDYEMSDAQRDAVQVIVSAASRYVLLMEKENEK